MWQHIIQFVLAHWIYVLLAVAASATIGYAAWSNWRVERQRIKALEAELNPKLERYDAAFRPPKKHPRHRIPRSVPVQKPHTSS